MPYGTLSARKLPTFDRCINMDTLVSYIASAVYLTRDFIETESWDG